MESRKHFRPMYMRLSLLCTVLISGCTGGSTSPRLIPSDLPETGGTLYVIEVFTDFLDGGPDLVHQPDGENGAEWVGQQALQIILRAVRRYPGCELKRLDHFELTDGDTTRLWPDEPIEYEEHLPEGETVIRAMGIRKGIDLTLKPSRDADSEYLSVWFDVSRVTTDQPPEIFRLPGGPVIGKCQIAKGRQTIPIGGALLFRVPVSDLREVLILVSIASIQCR